MKQRVITALVLIAVLFPLVYLGGWPMAVVMALGDVIAQYEILNLVAKQWPAGFRYALYPLSLLLLFSYKLWGAAVYLAVLGGIMMLLFAMAVVSEKVKLDDIALEFLYLGIFTMMGAGIFEIYAVSRWLMFVTAFGAIGTDTGAFFAGRRFGKHKLDPRISPKKTVEGSVGGILLGAAASITLGYFTLVKPGLVSWAFLVCAGLGITIVSQFGDLAFSAIKRHYGIKDFGNIFPGHGGVLDRLDSISFSCILVYILITVML
jgi:phosphatidate cytidylyltransferase